MSCWLNVRTNAGLAVKEKLVDEIVLYVAPCLLGSNARGLFDIPPLNDMRERIGTGDTGNTAD